MRKALLITSLIAFGVASASAAFPSVPRTNEVIRYERMQPVFQSRGVSREHGDALLALLDGGRSLEEWRVPTNIVCVLPVRPSLWMAVIHTNGTTNRIGFTHDGGLVYFDFPWQPFVLRGETRANVSRELASLETDLRREVVSTPKPCAYKLGTVDDGGTLSGVARLFYGDAKQSVISNCL